MAAGKAARPGGRRDGADGGGIIEALDGRGGGGMAVDVDGAKDEVEFGFDSDPPSSEREKLGTGNEGLAVSALELEFYEPCLGAKHRFQSAGVSARDALVTRARDPRAYPSPMW